MKRSLLILFLVAFIASNVTAQWSVTSGRYSPYNYTPPFSSGIETLYLLYGFDGVSLTFQAESDAPVTCYRYAFNAIQAEPVAFEQQGSLIRLLDPLPEYGYFIEQSGRRSSYIWLMDYTSHPLVIRSLDVDAEFDNCESVRLIFDRTAPDLNYFGINGRQERIDREYALSYQTLHWNEDKLTFESSTLNETVRGDREFLVDAPYQDTHFTLSGDQFLNYWSIPMRIESEYYPAEAVIGVAYAEQTLRDAGNELDENSGGLGGSAPVEIRFTGYSNYPVVTYEAWQISRDPEFGIIEATYTDPSLTYSFEQEGTTYVRFMISNADNSCSRIVESFSILTSESSLQVPNVFTPQSDTGRNLLFKVAYRSIIKFEGRVFNRWGNQLFHWTDPAEGWDGTHNGKLVPTGAYYYVIQAEGVGGKKYNLKGDINVLRTKP